MRISKSALFACAGAVLLAAAPSAALARGATIVLYQEDNFGGDSRTLHDDAEDLDWIRFDDRVSSVEVRRGVWELCEHSHFRGRCITVDHDISKLDRLGMDDRISSVRRIR